MRLALPAALVLAAACGSSASSGHGTPSTLSAAKTRDARFCEHRVPRDVCTLHNPHLVASFQEAGDWCGEHGVPESQCWECHPDLSFEPIPEPPAGADVRRISAKGEDVPDLEAHLAPGRVTVFDFYADWCGPCRKIDAHLYARQERGEPIAIRKLNIVAWDSPVARRHLARVAKIPYLVVYGRDGRPVSAITGFDLAALDRAIDEGARR